MLNYVVSHQDFRQARPRKFVGPQGLLCKELFWFICGRFWHLGISLVLHEKHVKELVFINEGSIPVVIEHEWLKIQVSEWQIILFGGAGYLDCCLFLWFGFGGGEW